MTRADDPHDGPETVSFGRGGSPEDAVTSVAEEQQTRQAGEVDAWYTEPDPEDGQTSPSWLSTRWHAWQRLSRDRRLVIVFGVVAVLAIVAALVGLAGTDDDPAVELPAVETHGLSPDEAACFAYGLIENRTDVRLGVEGFDTVDPTSISGTINQEIQALDDLPGSHPEADYRLITAFAAVADESTVLIGADALTDFRSAVSQRADAIAAANSACSEVAGFDVDELEPS